MILITFAPFRVLALHAGVQHAVGAAATATRQVQAQLLLLPPADGTAAWSAFLASGRAQKLQCCLEARPVSTSRPKGGMSQDRSNYLLQRRGKEVPLPGCNFEEGSQAYSSRLPLKIDHRLPEVAGSAKHALMSAILCSGTVTAGCTRTRTAVLHIREFGRRLDMIIKELC